MTLEQLEAIRAVKVEIATTRARILKGGMGNEERELEQQRLLSLTERQLQFEAAAEPTPPPPAVPDIAKIPPAEAAKRAAAIRARPEYWKPGTTLKEDGSPVISRAAHEQLRSELVELDARAGESEGQG